MNLEAQFKLKENPMYKKFLRENSKWYKYLNRYPEKFNDFTDEMKEKYKMRTTDKLNNVLTQIEMVQSIMSIIK